MPPGPRAQVLGCAIDRLDMAGAVARCEEFIAERRLCQHVSINVAKLVAMRNDPWLSQIVHGSELVTADGQAVVWASRLFGDPLPMRVAGIDLMWSLLELAERRGLRIFFLGARADVLQLALERIRARYPNLIVAGARDGYFAREQDTEVASEIAAARADILFVAMGSPQKEYFLGRHGRSLEIPLIMGVGGAVDVAAGVTRRAPLFLQRAGLEWLFRLVQEPRRLTRRYVMTNTRFVILVAREYVRGGPARRREEAAGSAGH